MHQTGKGRARARGVALEGRGGGMSEAGSAVDLSMLKVVFSCDERKASRQSSVVFVICYLTEPKNERRASDSRPAGRQVKSKPHVVVVLFELLNKLTS